LCWELPSEIPDDWQGFNLQKAHHPITVADMKAAIDATVLKQGIYVLTHHAGIWIRSDHVIELIDHATAKHPGKVKFLNFREVYDRLTQNLLGGQPLRAANGQDNGVRVLDVNNDGFMDVVIGNENLRQTRIWSPEKKQWTTTDFPVEIVTVDAQGNRRDAGVRFGVLQKNGFASVLVRNEKAAGLWHFDGRQWVADPQGLAGLEAGGPGGVAGAERSDAPVFTSESDRGVRMRDLDGDGVCELIVGNPNQQAVFSWSADRHSWQRLPFTLPAGTAIVDAQGRDAGLRLVDIDEDSHADVVFSNADHYSLHVFISMTQGWSRKILEGPQNAQSPIPPIVRADGTNNGVWFKYRHLWLQNEDTGGKEKPSQSLIRSYTKLLDGDAEPPARAPEDSRRSLLPRPGFRVELMAAEPMVMDPIDIAWGPDGKAWVVEMADYPLGMAEDGHIGRPNPPNRPGGRIRFLEDTDGDGRYDRSTIFLEPIAFPSGVMPWRKGVIITCAPETFYAEDSNGDGRADVFRTLFSGFREGNQQHRVNHPRWGLDNWVYLANGDSGGEIKSAKTGEVVNISGRDLRIRPDEGLLDPQAGNAQYGRNRDDWGSWFGCNNSDPGWHYAVADHYLRRNPHVAAPPSRIDVAGSRDAYPGGRVITHCYIPQPTPPEGTPGHWTSVAGVMIYRDDLFGPDYTGNLFVEDSVYNVVHRMILTPHGTTFRGDRAPDERQSEFLASADPWFRPATMQTGPDGALWVTDMYRFVIEHPEWIVHELTNKLELRRHSDKGRIYRIYPVDKRPRPIPRLDKLDTAGLVAALDHPNGWQRDMAQQMLVWRADKSAVGPLEAMAATNQRPLARLHAMCTLDGLGALRPEIVIRGLTDEHPGVRRHAVRLSESLVGSSPALGEALLKTADDPDPQVQLQLAYSLGEWDDPRAGRLLGRLALRHAEDPYISAAAMSSAVLHVDAMLAEVRASSSPDAAGQASPSDRAKLAGALQKLAAAIRAEPELTTAAKNKRIGGSPVRPIEPSRQEVERLLGGIASGEEIQQMMAKYSPVLNMYGDPERGKKVFVEATCATCHLFRDVGQRIGPDLETLIDRSSKTLLVAVVDPNRACIDRYAEHVAVTKDGLTHPGMLVEETSNSATLVNADGMRQVLLRKDLDELVFTGRSHMPEGLPAKMDLQQMADLFAFLGAGHDNIPAKVHPDKTGVLLLRAAQAEVHGPGIAFEPKYGNLGMWLRAEGYATWSLDVKQAGTYDVWLDWACHDSMAGNQFELAVDSERLHGKVPGTGNWDTYHQEKFGRVKLAPGDHRLVVRPAGPLKGALIDLRTVVLAPPDVKWQPPK
jgi:putative membrane-bound dehydrogenase-like protein